MSCDDNKEARAKDRQKRRSLPIVTAEAPRPSTAAAAQAAAPRQSSRVAAPRYWRSIEEREAAKAVALGAVNEFPPGADELAEGSVSRPVPAKAHRERPAAPPNATPLLALGSGLWASGLGHVPCRLWPVLVHRLPCGLCRLPCRMCEGVAPTRPRRITIDVDEA